jgi:hypothetical protein
LQGFELGQAQDSARVDVQIAQAQIGQPGKINEDSSSILLFEIKVWPK